MKAPKSRDDRWTRTVCRTGRARPKNVAPKRFSRGDRLNESNANPTNPEGNANGLLSLLGSFFQKNDLLASLLQIVNSGAERLKADEAANVPNAVIPRPHRIAAAQTVQAGLGQNPQSDDPASGQIPTINFSIDGPPESAASGAAPNPFPPMSTEWKSVLFGPKGILTEAFHFMNERRKQAASEKTPQAEPAAPIAGGDFDFAKIFDAILTKSGDGKFDEPQLPELPFIGLCNRLSCGDIFKAVDAFKKSEMFSNFQTAISLFQDPKGLDIIGSLLENPDLIEQYVGKSANIGELFGKAGGSSKSKSKSSRSSSNSILPSDGDLGKDFTSEADGGPEAKPLVIAENTDGGDDYYSEVENGSDGKAVDVEDYDLTESVDVEETIPITTTTKASVLPEKKEEPPLPELSFSVDGPEEAENVEDYGETFDKEERVPVAVPIPVPTAGPVSRRGLVDSEISGSMAAATATTPVRTSTQATTTVRIVKTTTTAKPRKNFRRSDDYYAMYYDD
uniref:ULP_PROTEASE domain-containing protein n=1 Tax=Panagrellus redivivus TaxID=6233 RepID=A0A7E4VRX3_PANRE